MITFIMPTYNQGKYIRYALDSVMANMRSSDELIVADGASTDCTEAVVLSYSGDPRLIFFSERDRGFSDAVRKALERAHNPIIGIMSSDDAYLPNVRDRVLEHFEDADVALVYADYEIIDENNRKIGERNHRRANSLDLLSLRVLLPQSSVFFRRVALQGQPILDLKYDYIADVVLFNQICRVGRWLYVPELWSRVRKHSGSRTGTKNPGEQYLRALEEAFGTLTPEEMRFGRAGGMLLRARYEASCGQRLKAVASAASALREDLSLPISHWLFPRTLAHIVLGPRYVKWLQLLLERG